MRRKGLRVGAAVGTAGILAAVMAGQAAAAPPGTKTLPGSVPAWANASHKTGTVPSTDHVGFRVYLGWQGDATALDRAVSTPGSPQYHQYLSAAQFRAEFSPSRSQVTAVQQWLRGQGFTVDYTPSNNLYVAADGTVAQAEAAFGSTLGEYSYEGQTLRSPETALTVPASLNIQSVVGLDDSAELVHTDQVSSDAPPPAAFVNGGPCSSYWGQDTTANTKEPTPLNPAPTSSNKNPTPVTTPGGVSLPDAYAGEPTDFAPCGYTPSQLRGAYGLNSADTGAGQTVAIIDAYASPTIVSDANQYFANHNGGATGSIPPLGGSNFSQVVAPGTYHHPEEGAKQDPQGWYGEETLDVEAVHSMAPGADITFVGAPNSFQDLDAALNHVVDKQLATLVTNSYGWSSEDLPSGFILSYYDIMQQAVAEGIGVYFSSGDNGDETGGSGNLSQSTPDWPASSDLVTAVGGTSLAVGLTNSRVGEWGWETGKSLLTQNANGSLSWTPAAPGKYLYGSGGGTSRLFGQPAYQAGIVPTSMSGIYGNTNPMRVVPDVAAIGDPNTGMLIGETQTFPDGSARYSEYRIGGTSLASPTFTGIMADAQAAAGADIGFANPLLYGLASNGRAFNDITPATMPGSKTPPPALVRSDYTNTVDATNGYSATVRSIDFDTPLTIHVQNGYDNVTGIGSPATAFVATVAAAGKG